MSCGAACARQLLLDSGINVPEVDLREDSGYDAQRGIVLEHLRDTLRMRLPTADFEGGTLMDPDAVTELHAPFIVLIRKHFLIVDYIDETEVHMRDPAPVQPADTNGADLVVARAAFDEAWGGGIIFPRSKP